MHNNLSLCSGSLVGTLRARASGVILASRSPRTVWPAAGRQNRTADALGMFTTLRDGNHACDPDLIAFPQVQDRPSHRMAAAAASSWQEPAKHKSKRRKAIRQLLNGNDSIGFASPNQLGIVQGAMQRQAADRARPADSPSARLEPLMPALQFKVGNRAVADLKPDVRPAESTRLSWLVQNTAR